MERQAVEPPEGEFQAQKASDSIRIAGPAAVARTVLMIPRGKAISGQADMCHSSSGQTIFAPWASSGRIRNISSIAPPFATSVRSQAWLSLFIVRNLLAARMFATRKSQTCQPAAVSSRSISTLARASGIILGYSNGVAGPVARCPVHAPTREQRERRVACAWRVG